MGDLNPLLCHLAALKNTASGRFRPVSSGRKVNNCSQNPKGMGMRNQVADQSGECEYSTTSIIGIIFNEI